VFDFPCDRVHTHRGSVWITTCKEIAANALPRFIFGMGLISLSYFTAEGYATAPTGIEGGQPVGRPAYGESRRAGNRAGGTDIKQPGACFARFFYTKLLQVRHSRS
jgi:hypothetical protein